MSEVEVTGVEIKLGRKTITLTPAEAKLLLDKLQELFGERIREVTREVHHHHEHEYTHDHVPAPWPTHYYWFPPAPVWPPPTTKPVLPNTSDWYCSATGVASLTAKV